jgi:hypothetical protein
MKEVSAGIDVVRVVAFGLIFIGFVGMIAGSSRVLGHRSTRTARITRRLWWACALISGAASVLAALHRFPSHGGDPYWAVASAAIGILALASALVRRSDRATFHGGAPPRRHPH